VRSPSHVETALNLKVKKTEVNDAAGLRQAAVAAYGPIGLTNRFFAKKLMSIFLLKLMQIFAQNWQMFVSITITKTDVSLMPPL
jgi:hypothetical protein